MVSREIGELNLTRRSDLEPVCTNRVSYLYNSIKDKNLTFAFLGFFPPFNTENGPRFTLLENVSTFPLPALRLVLCKNSRRCNTLFLLELPVFRFLGLRVTDVSLGKVLGLRGLPSLARFGRAGKSTRPRRSEGTIPRVPSSFLHRDQWSLNE